MAGPVLDTNRRRVRVRRLHRGLTFSQHAKAALTAGAHIASVHTAEDLKLVRQIYGELHDSSTTCFSAAAESTLG